MARLDYPLRTLLAFAFEQVSLALALAAHWTDIWHCGLKPTEDE